MSTFVLTPKFVYGATPTTLALTIAQRPWSPSSQAVGGAELGAPTPAAYVVRRDELLDVTLRFHESEWAAVRAWLVWAQALPNTFDYFPDLYLSAFHTCYLVSPVMGEPIRPVREETFGVYEIGLQFRKVDGTAWDLTYWT